MNILLIILTVFVSIVGVLLLAALFIKKEYAIHQEIIVNKLPQEVFSFIKILKNQDFYNKWWMTDPNTKKEFKGTDGTVGFVTFWDSDNKQIGKGEQEIKKITEGERIDFEIRFIKPFEGMADTYMITESCTANQTLVKWAFTGKNKYPMNLIYKLFNLEKALGNDLQESLVRLKNILEK